MPLPLHLQCDTAPFVKACATSTLHFATTATLFLHASALQVQPSRSKRHIISLHQNRPKAVLDNRCSLGASIWRSYDQQRRNSFDASFAILKLLSRFLLTRVYFREHTCFQSYDESCVTFTMRRKAMANAASVQSLKQITAQKNSPLVTQSSATNAGSASESNAQKTQHLVSFSQEEIDKKLT